MQNEIPLMLTMLLVMAMTFWPNLPATALAAISDIIPDHKKPEEAEWEKNVMFKKGGSTTVKQDPAIGQAAIKEAELGEQWMNFAKEQFGVANKRQEEQDKIANQVTQQQLDASKQAQGWATEDRNRYENTFVPLQNEFIDKAQNWDSAERQQQMASEAKADVLTNAGQQRAATQRQQASMGVSPTSGRYAGVDRGAEGATALAAAGAQNQARNTVRNQAMSLKGDAINLGSGLGVNPATSLGLSSSTGSAAMGTTAGNNAQAAGLTSMVGSGYQGAMNGYGSQANILNQQFQNNLANQQMKNQGSQSLWGGLGSLAGMGMMAWSSKELKTDKTPVEDGKALDAVNSMPIEEWTYKDGVADGGRHIGPYAEDFQRATGKGDGKAINLVDGMGLTMRAIQDLNKKIDSLGSGGEFNRNSLNSGAPGMVEVGNIDIHNRPTVHNADGSISTVRTISINDGQNEVLIPTVSDDGKIMSDRDAVQQYMQTGRHLGKFKTPEEATNYAISLHNEQDQEYGRPGNTSGGLGLSMQ